ncbi:hypothetical protein ACWFPY_22570 [Nocardia fluminea]
MAGNRLRCKAFLLTQNLDELEALALDEFRVFQVAVAEVEQRAHCRFPAALHIADTFVTQEPVAHRSPLESTADINW